MLTVHLCYKKDEASKLAAVLIENVDGVPASTATDVYLGPFATFDEAFSAFSAVCDDTAEVQKLKRQYAEAGFAANEGDNLRPTDDIFDDIFKDEARWKPDVISEDEC